MGNLRTRYRKAKKVPWRTIAGEAVLVNLRSREVLHLNESAAEIWKILDGQRSVSALVEHLCEVFDVSKDEAERDTLEILSRLEASGSIESVEQ